MAAPASVTAPLAPSVAMTGVRNAEDNPALPDEGALASVTPVPAAVWPEPNGPFIVTAQATAWPLSSNAAKPVAPKSSGRLAIANLSSAAFVAAAVAAARLSCGDGLPL